MKVDFTEIQNDIKETKSLLLSLINSNQSAESTNDVEQVLTVEECAKFLHLKKATIYKKISDGDLPVIKKAKRCYFLKTDLIKYLEKDRKQSNQEIKDEVDSILNKPE